MLGNYVISDRRKISDNFGGMSTILLPLVISALGIVFDSRRPSDSRRRRRQRSGAGALNRGNWGSIILTATARYFLVDMMLPEQLTMSSSAKVRAPSAHERLLLGHRWPRGGRDLVHDGVLHRTRQEAGSDIVRQLHRCCDQHHRRSRHGHDSTGPISSSLPRFTQLMSLLDLRVKIAACSMMATTAAARD